MTTATLRALRHTPPDHGRDVSDFEGAAHFPRLFEKSGVTTPVDAEPFRLAVPRRGHVLSTVVENYGAPLREAVAVLSRSLAGDARCAPLHDSLFGPATWRPDSDMVRPVPEMAAWAIVSMWTVAVACKALPASATFAESEHWFFGSLDVPGRLTSLPPPQVVKEAESVLALHADPTAYHELLPYILDPHGPGSRLSVQRDPSTRVARTRKRNEGIFYTPADIAEFMATACLDSADTGERPPSVFDPACGTGVFLRVALQELCRRHPKEAAHSLASRCLFGADSDPWPIDAAVFVLVADVWGRRARNRSAPAVLWRRLHRNFACIDTLRLDPPEAGPAKDPNRAGRVALSRLFPALKKGADVILGNPPYADLGDRNDVAALALTFETIAVKPRRTAEIYLSFIEQMIRLASNETCVAALVVPLSIACNVGPQFVAIRKLIERTPGLWQFAFFDREPHALFGEDVKTRNAIVLWSKKASDKEAVIATGPLRKWRGESRAAMFRSLRYTPIHSRISTGIPKIDSTGQAEALILLANRSAFLEQAVQEIARRNLSQVPYADECTVFIGPTAYNFVNVFIKPPRGLLSCGEVLSEHPLYAVRCASRTDAFAVFAILTSHLAYWWWHVHGDGFHVSRRFISGFPFGPEALKGGAGSKLAASGTQLWSKISTHPIISLNRDRTSLAYTPNGHDEIRRQTDQTLADLAGLPGAFVEELQQFTAHTVAASLGPNGPNQTNHKEGT